MQEWDQQEGESAKAFFAFSQYLKLTDRSLAKLAEKGTKGVPKVTQLKKWSRTQNWVARAEAYDAHIAREALHIFEGKRLQRQVDLQNDEWDASQELIARAKAINKLPLTERYVESEDKDEHGRVIRQFITIKPVRHSARDAARLLVEASRLGRLSTGLETDRIKVEMEVQAQLEELLSDLRNALSPAALAEFDAYLLARTGQRTEERVLS